MLDRSSIVPVLILIGPPGCGKGTQAEMIYAAFKLSTISTGVLLREEMAAKTEIGKEITKVMSSGGLVNDATVLALLSNKMKDKLYAKGVILDGFPRNMAQAKGLDIMLEESDENFKLIAIHIEVPEAVVVERISNRYYCTQCQTNYNKLYKNSKVPGTCDVCGGHNFAVRADDKADIIKSRLHTYYSQTVPLLRYYTTLGVLINVDGNARQDAIFQKISGILKQKL